MPGYNNPYYGPTYPMSGYGGYSGSPIMPQQSYAPPPQPAIAAAWVEGEIEAHGRQMPGGATQFFMFDVNRQKIYLKSLNQMGLPNPMQVLSYTIDEQPQANLQSGQNSQNGYSGNSMSGHQDMSQFVTKQDLEQLKNEIRNMNQSGSNNSSYSNNSGNNSNSGNQNGGNSSQNRGGNR